MQYLIAKGAGMVAMAQRQTTKLAKMGITAHTITYN